MTDGLLLIHAFPLDASMWQPQIEALRAEVPIVAPHFPGFGDAPASGPLTSMDGMAERCAQALDAAGLERAVVCGLSMGGYAALAFWRGHRERVAGLILANTRAGADDDAAKARRADLAARLRLEGNRFLVESPPPLLSQAAPAELWERVRAIIAGQSAQSIAAAAMGMAERPDFTPDLSSIDVPTLVITGSADTLIPPAATKETATAIPGAEYHEIEGAGHLSNLEAPEVFNQLLRAHLVRCGVLLAH